MILTALVVDLVKNGATVERSTHSDGHENLPLEIYSLRKCQFYWTLEGNRHCFGPFTSSEAAITHATERK